MPPTSSFASQRGPGAARGEAWFAGVRASDAVECIDVTADPQGLARPGFWVVVGEFDGRVRAWRFDQVERGGSGDPGVAGRWRGPAAEAWSSSLDREGYERAVNRVRREILAGEVYQANICRVLSAPLPAADDEPGASALAAVLAAGNPAPFAGGIHVPATSGLEPVWVVSASPELFLRIDGGMVTSSPIKGTAATAAGLSAKDEAENVMITDLVRNDLQQVCRPGTVEVTSLLGVEEHPGLVHLVSTVRGELEPGLDRSADLWPRLLAATYPPGSVSGAPKLAALRLIAELEPVARGPYCGAVGWVDVAPDRAVRAELAVGIRTFWWTADGPGGGTLRFGTGAGITWGSDPRAEWLESELKADRLVALASGAPAARPGGRLHP